MATVSSMDPNIASVTRASPVNKRQEVFAGLRSHSPASPSSWCSALHIKPSLAIRKTYFIKIMLGNPPGCHLSCRSPVWKHGLGSKAGFLYKIPRKRLKKARDRRKQQGRPWPLLHTWWSACVGCTFTQNTAALVCFHAYVMLLFISLVLRKTSKWGAIVTNTKMVAEPASL